MAWVVPPLKPVKKYQFDELKMYFRKPLKVAEGLTVYQPTVGEIVEFGEQKYYGAVHELTCIPSDMKSQLWDMGINWMELSDFSLFCMLSKNLTPDKTRLILGDLDLSEMSLGEMPSGQQTDSAELVLFSENQNVIITEENYNCMVQYLRKIHNIKPKIERAQNKNTFKLLIKLDRDKVLDAKERPYVSQLKPLISAMMRYPAFPYKRDELERCGIYEFMDSVIGAQIYVSSTALLQGSYSGMVDTSNINKKEFDWMRSTDTDKDDNNNRRFIENGTAVTHK